MATVKKKSTLPKLTRQRIFLNLYAECGNLTTAAMGARVDVSAHYKWLAEDGYREEFDKAHDTALDLLEAEARRRAIEGDPEPAVYQGALCYERLANGRKKQIVFKRKSDNLLMFLLKAGRPEKFRDQWKGEIKHSGAVATQSLDVSNLSDEQLAQLSVLLQAAGIGDAEASSVSTGSSDTGDPAEETQSH